MADINVNPINVPGLAAYAGNRIGNLGLSFGKIDQPKFTIPPQRTDTALSEIGSGLQQMMGYRNDAQKQALVAQQAEKQRALQMQMQQMREQGMMARQKEAQAARKEEFKMKLDAAINKEAEKKAKEIKKPTMEKRMALGMNYLNSPEIMNDEERTGKFFNNAAKKEIITNNEATSLIDMEPKRRIQTIEMDLLTSGKAINLQKKEKQKKKKVVGIEAAGKSAGLKPGWEDIQTAKGLFINEAGELDRTNLSTAQSAPYGLMEGVPFTKGREARQAMERALTTKLRIESGAAVPDTEVERYMNMFMPTPLDSRTSIDAKFKGLEDWYKNVQKEIKPDMSPEERLGAARSVAEKSLRSSASNADDEFLKQYNPAQIKALEQRGYSRQDIVRRLQQGAQ